MKNLLLIFLLIAFKVSAQTPFPLYVPTNPDSIKTVVNVNGAPRTVYNIDLVRYRAAMIAKDTAAALRLLIVGNTSAITSNTTAIGLKADKSATISINGSSQTLGSNPNFTVSGGSGSSSKQLVVNLADYADSTGATDATTGINNAIAATPSGGILFVGPGVFKTTGGHVISKKITLRGAGGGGYNRYISGGYYFKLGASTIFSTSTTATVFDFSGETPVIENLDIRLDSTLTPTTAIGIKITAGSSFRMTNVSLFHFNIGMHIVNAGLWSIDKCFFNTNRSEGLRIENQRFPDEGDASISNSWFGGSMAFPGAAYTGSGQTGIRQYSGGGLKIVNTKFNSGLSTCIDIAVTVNTSIVQIANNSFENFYAYGVKVDAGVIFQFPQIVGNEFAPYSTITGNCIFLNGATFAVKDALIANNIFRDGNSNSNAAVQLTSVNGYYAGANRYSGWANTISTTGSTNGEVPLLALDNGSATQGFSSNLTFGNPTTAVAGNMYGISVAKFGVDYIMMGINKNTATGNIPAGASYLSTYGNNTLAFGRGGGTGLPDKNDLTITPTGKVVIGTGTTPSTTGMLQVPNYSVTANHAEFGGISVQSYALNNGYVMDNLYYNSGFKYRANGYANTLNYFNGGYVFQTAPSGIAGNNATLTNRMYLTNAGFLGVGNLPNPNSKLDIDGATTIRTMTEPVTPPAGSVIEWWDGTNKKWKKSDGTTGVIY